jgi:hypothetical protein
VAASDSDCPSRRRNIMHLALRLLACLALAAAVAWPAVAPAGTITAYTALEEDDVKVYL